MSIYCDRVRTSTMYERCITFFTRRYISRCVVRSYCLLLRIAGASCSIVMERTTDIVYILAKFANRLHAVKNLIITALLHNLTYCI